MYKDIKTFEDACKALSIGTEVPEVSVLPEKHRKAIIAHYKLVIIAQAVNEGWEPDWDDYNDRKYYPWFDVERCASGSGFGLSYDVFGYSISTTGVGSRLCFKSANVANYVGEQFKELYEDYFLIN